MLCIDQFLNINIRYVKKVIHVAFNSKIEIRWKKSTFNWGFACDLKWGHPAAWYLFDETWVTLQLLTLFLWNYSSDTLPYHRLAIPMLI